MNEPSSNQLQKKTRIRYSPIAKLIKFFIVIGIIKPVIMTQLRVKYFLGSNLINNKLEVDEFEASSSGFEVPGLREYLSQYESRFKSMINLEVPQNTLTIGSGINCGDLSPIPGDVAGSFTDQDIRIIVSPKSDSDLSSLKSRGEVCVFDGTIADKRPILGIIYINYESLDLINKNQSIVGQAVLHATLQVLVKKKFKIIQGF